jgi:hypothetical protein
LLGAREPTTCLRSGNPDKADADVEALRLERRPHRGTAGDQQPLDQTVLAIGGVVLVQECRDPMRDIANSTHKLGLSRRGFPAALDLHPWWEIVTSRREPAARRQSI